MSNPVSTRRDLLRRGLTLIELLVAGILTTLLMGSVLLLLRVTYADAARLSAETTTPPTLLAEQIVRDLTNSRGVRIAPGRLSLTGFVGTRRRMPTLQRGRVGYAVRRIGATPCLVRTEESGGLATREVVWVGVGSFQVIDLTPADPDDPVRRDPDAGGLPPTPRLVQLQLTDKQGRTLINERVARAGVL